MTTVKAGWSAESAAPAGGLTDPAQGSAGRTRGQLGAIAASLAPGHNTPLAGTAFEPHVGP
jgi:hypothetical protein